jgi:segregation and condensation protein B
MNMSDQTTEPILEETSQSSEPERAAAAEDESAESLESVAEGFVGGDELDQKTESARKEVVIHDAGAEDAAEEAARLALEGQANVYESPASTSWLEDETPEVRSMAQLMAIIEALIFVSEEPLTVKIMADVIQEDRGWIETAVEELAQEFNERNSGLQLREVGGGWQIATRPEHHEYVRAYLKSRPSAKLSLASLETLAVIAYKQPITVPEILEIRGVQSPSAIKTLLDKRLIIAKGRKETIGRPMMYGTSKEFLLQFGLKDLSELPSIEDFEDLAGGM